MSLDLLRRGDNSGVFVQVGHAVTSCLLFGGEEDATPMIFFIVAFLVSWYDGVEVCVGRIRMGVWGEVSVSVSVSMSGQGIVT